MGEVYRARDARLGRDVAVKVLPADFAADPERLARFEQEARAASSLNHAHILAVYDVGRSDGAPYIVTELLDGQTLSERIAQGPVPLRRALEWAAGAARGLAAAGLRDSLTASRALGYRQVLRYLEGEISEERARELTIVGTRKFARRQDSWFRNDGRIVWLAFNHPDLVAAAYSLAGADGTGAQAGGITHLAVED